MKVSEDIRKIAVDIKTNPSADESCLENLALRGDSVSKYAIAKIVELNFAFEHKKQQMNEDIRDVLNNAYKKLDECKGVKQGIVDVMMEIDFILKNLERTA